MDAQASLFAEAPPLPEGPPGFRYQPQLISAAEEAELAAWIETLPLRPYEFQNFLAHRLVAAFGHRYDYGSRKLLDAQALPPELLPLQHKVAQFARRPEQDFVQALVTRYEPGVPIGWHRDRPQFEVVAGVSLLSPAPLRLRLREGERWLRYTQPLAPRSVYLLQGEARTAWEHSIAPLPARRCSITFRTLAAARPSTPLRRKD